MASSFARAHFIATEQNEQWGNSVPATSLAFYVFLSKCCSETCVHTTWSMSFDLIHLAGSQTHKMYSCSYC